jgi:SynChlorMet cassette radical SAM/SPASM protein ScmF
MLLKVEQIMPNGIMSEASSIITLPENVPPLNWLYLYISGSCNLACKHCWISPNYIAEGKGGRFVPLELVDKAIHEGLPLGLKAVKLTGGEPTLHPQFCEMVKMIDQANLKIIMETNATLIDDNLANFITDTANFSFVSVSLDGADSQTHEALRMIPGCFEQAIRGIRNLVKLGMPPQVICTLYQGNQNQILDMINLTQDLGCASIKFNHLQKSGRGENLIKHEGLSVSELIEIYSYITNELEPNSKIPIMFDIPFAFFSLRKLLAGNNATCGVHNIMGMLSGGELSICGIGEIKTDLVYGNIQNDSLSDVWFNADGLKLIRELIPAKLEGVCGDCLHRDLCLGECIANNFQENGRINSAYYFCAQANDAGLFPSSRRRNNFTLHQME